MVVVKEYGCSRKSFISDYLDTKQHQAEIYPVNTNVEQTTSFEYQLNDIFNHPTSLDPNDTKTTFKYNHIIKDENPNKPPNYMKNFRKFLKKTNRHLDQVLANNTKIDFVHEIVAEIQKPLPEIKNFETYLQNSEQQFAEDDEEEEDLSEDENDNLKINLNEQNMDEIDFDNYEKYDMKDLIKNNKSFSSSDQQKVKNSDKMKLSKKKTYSNDNLDMKILKQLENNNKNKDEYKRKFQNSNITEKRLTQNLKPRRNIASIIDLRNVESKVQSFPKRKLPPKDLTPKNFQKPTFTSRNHMSPRALQKYNVPDMCPNYERHAKSERNANTHREKMQSSYSGRVSYEAPVSVINLEFLNLKRRH